MPVLNQNPERYGTYKTAIAPLRTVPLDESIRRMSDERFLNSQRKAINVVLAIFIGLLAFIWIATAADWLFALGWGWDRQILWLAPPMMLFAALVRFCAFAIFKFVGSNF